ncbi:MAG: hypothetical protein ACOYIR_09320 [Christensenellales bacterium]|jgi:hypothetical protein
MNKLVAWICFVVFLISLIVVSGCAPAPAADSGFPGGADSKAPDAPAQGPVECNWVLKVDHTIPVTTDGLTVNYTLVLIAQKVGGTDVYGTYEGAAYIASVLDASNLSNEFFEVTGGFDLQAYANDLSFELVPYDIEEYSRYGIAEDDIPLAPLVRYESMALLSPEMTGGGVLNPYVLGDNVTAGYYDTACGTAPVAMKIVVNSGKVEVTVPSLTYESFKGLLLGEPDGDLYQEGLDRIESLIEDSESQQETPDDDDTVGDTEGMGSILGTMGSNLALPSSFPVEDFPLTADADIINVYENENGKNIRIMFGTSESYEDLLAYYAPIIDELESRYDVEGGVMYMGSSEKYKNIILMITEDLSKTYKNMVMLEILKK